MVTPFDAVNFFYPWPNLISNSTSKFCLIFSFYYNNSNILDYNYKIVLKWPLHNIIQTMKTVFQVGMELDAFEKPKLTLQFWNSSGPGESATFVVWLPWLLCRLVTMVTMSSDKPSCYASLRGNAFLKHPSPLLNTIKYLVIFLVHLNQTSSKSIKQLREH